MTLHLGVLPRHHLAISTGWPVHAAPDFAGECFVRVFHLSVAFVEVAELLGDELEALGKAFGCGLERVNVELGLCRLRFFGESALIVGEVSPLRHDLR